MTCNACTIQGRHVKGTTAIGHCDACGGLLPAALKAEGIIPISIPYARTTGRQMPRVHLQVERLSE